MIAGHYAAGMVAHQRCPRGSLAFFLVVAQLQDLAWLCFHYLGLEPTSPAQAWDMTLAGLVVDMTWSHDVVPVAGWALAVAAAGYALYRDRRVALAGALLVLLHVATDDLAGFPHNVFGPKSAVVGTGLYRSAPFAAVAFEFVFSAAALLLFFRAERAGGRRHSMGEVAAVVAPFALNALFAASVADTSFAARTGLHFPELPFGTAVPSMLALYVGLLLYLRWVLTRPAAVTETPPDA